MSDEKNLINKIQYNRKNNQKFFDDNLLNNVYKKVVNKTLRINNDAGKIKSAGTQISRNGTPADNVIRADKNTRAAIQELVLALAELGDPDIALKLIADHIFFLNDIFSDFEKIKEPSNKEPANKDAKEQ
jgi:hypothetical protein